MNSVCLFFFSSGGKRPSGPGRGTETAETADADERRYDRTADFSKEKKRSSDSICVHLRYICVHLRSQFLAFRSSRSLLVSSTPKPTRTLSGTLDVPLDDWEHRVPR